MPLRNNNSAYWVRFNKGCLIENKIENGLGMEKRKKHFRKNKTYLICRYANLRKGNQ